MNGQEPDLVQRDFDRYDRACEREAALDDEVEDEAREILNRLNKTLLGRVLKRATYSLVKEHREIADYLQGQAEEYAESMARRAVEKWHEDNADAAAACEAWQQEQDRRDRYDY